MSLNRSWGVHTISQMETLIQTGTCFCQSRACLEHLPFELQTEPKASDILNQWFSNGGNFVLFWRTLGSIQRHSWFSHLVEEGVDTGIQSVQARDSAKYPTTPKSAPIERTYPAQNAGSAETKKPCTNSLRGITSQMYRPSSAIRKHMSQGSVYSSQHHIFI